MSWVTMRVRNCSSVLRVMVRLKISRTSWGDPDRGSRRSPVRKTGDRAQAGRCFNTSRDCCIKYQFVCLSTGEWAKKIDFEPVEVLQANVFTRLKIFLSTARIDIVLHR